MNPHLMYIWCNIYLFMQNMTRTRSAMHLHWYMSLPDRKIPVQSNGFEQGYC
jgi:hypothetical protein